MIIWQPPAQITKCERRLIDTPCRTYSYSRYRRGAYRGKRVSVHTQSGQPVTKRRMSSIAPVRFLLSNRDVRRCSATRLSPAQSFLNPFSTTAFRWRKAGNSARAARFRDEELRAFEMKSKEPQRDIGLYGHAKRNARRTRTTASSTRGADVNRARRAYWAIALAVLISVMSACRRPQQPEPPADPPTPQSDFRSTR